MKKFIAILMLINHTGTSYTAQTVRKVWPPATKLVSNTFKPTMDLILPAKFMLGAFRCDCTARCKLPGYAKNIERIKREMDDAAQHPLMQHHGPYRLAFQRCAQDLLTQRCKGLPQ